MGENREYLTQSASDGSINNTEDVEDAIASEAIGEIEGVGAMLTAIPCWAAGTACGIIAGNIIIGILCNDVIGIRYCTVLCSDVTGSICISILCWSIRNVGVGVLRDRILRVVGNDWLGI